MKIGMFILLILSGAFASAQDLHYSHFMQTPLQRGVTETGNFNGDLRVAGIQRRQWASVSTPYQSLSIGADGKAGTLLTSLKGLNVGVQLNYDRAGDGNLTMLQTLMSLSYQIPLDANAAHVLRAGIDGGFVQRSINFNALYFDNQFTGDTYQPNAPTGENFSRDNFVKGDWGFGFGWRGNFDKAMMDAGFQILHVNRAESNWLINGNENYPALYQITMSGATKSDKSLQWLPAITYLRQDKNTEFTGGTEAMFHLREKPVRTWAFSLAAFYRYRDAVIPQIALYYDKFRFGFSYDINVSGLRPASKGRGASEFSIVYIVKKIKSEAKTSTVCPVY